MDIDQTGLKQAEITCLNCTESDVITFDEKTHFVLKYQKKDETPFLSFRWRPDWVWGVQCRCLNDNRIAPMESDQLDQLVSADSLSLSRIAESLTVPDTQQFRIEEKD
jgi:hypothetical protein